jgi:hypothetical protein
VFGSDHNTSDDRVSELTPYAIHNRHIIFHQIPKVRDKACSSAGVGNLFMLEGRINLAVIK